MTYKGSFKQHVWTHNSYIGSARRMEISAQAIMSSPSTSPRAKLLAEKIANLSRELQADLRKERIDP